MAKGRARRPEGIKREEEDAIAAVLVGVCSSPEEKTIWYQRPVNSRALLPARNPHGNSRPITSLLSHSSPWRQCISHTFIILLDLGVIQGFSEFSPWFAIKKLNKVAIISTSRHCGLSWCIHTGPVIGVVGELTGANRIEDAWQLEHFLQRHRRIGAPLLLNSDSAGRMEVIFVYFSVHALQLSCGSSYVQKSRQHVQEAAGIKCTNALSGIHLALVDMYLLYFKQKTIWYDDWTVNFELFKLYVPSLLAPASVWWERWFMNMSIS